jgi:hypothetical protein
MGLYISAWIKKYILHVESPSLLIIGYRYEYDYLMANKKVRDKE